jgi:hypothetical protein
LSVEQKVELVDKQFVGLLPALFNAATDDDIETGFSLVQHLVGELDSKQQLTLVAKLVTALTSSPTVATQLKLTLLTSLFNSSYLETANGAATRASIYMALIQLALASGNARLLTGSYNDIDAWINEWKLPKAKQAELYLLLSQLTKAADQT